MQIEVLSGGMILPETPVPISAVASFYEETYPKVSNETDAVFGPDFLWHVHQSDESDWFPNSQKPAVALCVFRELLPEKQVSFVANLQYALFFEGRDLTDDEAYRSVLEKYHLDTTDFFNKMHGEEHSKRAREDFALIKKLGIKGFPCLLLQTGESKMYLVNAGYSKKEAVVEKLEQMFREIAKLN